MVAAAPAADETEAEDSSAPKAALQRTEFGVDLGGANSVAGLRALWRGFLKTRAYAPVFELRPIIVIKEGANGLGLQLRLVAGPLRDAGAAAKICAVLSENNRRCETTIFDGQRLTMKDEAPSAASPPVPAKPVQRRQSVPKGAAASAGRRGGAEASRKARRSRSCSAGKGNRCLVAAACGEDLTCFRDRRPACP